MDKIRSNDQEKGLPVEEPVEPPIDTDTVRLDHESSNKEHQEKDSDAEQVAEERGDVQRFRVKCRILASEAGKGRP